MRLPVTPSLVSFSAALLLAITPVLASASPASAQAPSITLLSPAPNQEISGSSLLVRVHVDGITLDGTKIGTAAAAGVGHWHLNVDGKYAGLSVSDVISLPNPAMPTIPAGQHEITVDLHNNDHTPVQGATAARATITLANELRWKPKESTKPDVTILWPSNRDAIASDQPIVVHLEVGGITFDGTKIGTAAAAGVGHWHLNVDGKYAGLSVSDVISLPNPAFPLLTAGTHVLRADLHNNDHTPVQGADNSEVTIFVDRPIALAGVPMAAAAPAAQPTAVAAATPAAGGAEGEEGGSLTLGQFTYSNHGIQSVAGMSEFRLEADSFYFEPTFLRGTPGQRLRLEVENESDVLHNFSIAAQGIDRDVPAHGSADVEVTFPQSGALRFFCKYHVPAGMNGQLLVGETATPQPVSE